VGLLCFFSGVSQIVLGPTSGLKAVDLARIRHDDMKLTQNCSGDDSLVPHDFLHDLKLLQVVNQIRFVQFSIVGSIMLDMLLNFRSFRCT